MPRNVRNFWITLTVDGKRTRVATGPVRKDGGFDLTIKMRDHGGIVEVLDVLGRADDAGKLTLTARTSDHNRSIEVLGER